MWIKGIEVTATNLRHVLFAGKNFLRLKVCIQKAYSATSAADAKNI